MKALWNILSVVAVANLIALASFLLWLKATDRLDAGRATALRAVLSRTLTEERAEADKIAAEEAVAAEAAAQAQAQSRPPQTAMEALAARDLATELDIQRAQRLREEISELQARLSRELNQVQRERSALDAARASFAATVGAAQARLDDEQFQKTLGVLVALKPAQSAALLQQMLSTTEVAFAPVSAAESPVAPPAQSTASSSESGIAQVVHYLDAMDEKARVRVMTEFARTDPRLATDLLHRLRTLATLANGPASANPDDGPSP